MSQQSTGERLKALEQSGWILGNHGEEGWSLTHKESGRVTSRKMYLSDILTEAEEWETAQPAPVETSAPLSSQSPIVIVELLKDITSREELSAFIEGHNLSKLEEEEDERFSEEEREMITRALDEATERVMAKFTEEAAPTPPPEKAAEVHRREAHEIDLRDQALKHLEATGYGPGGYQLRRNVECAAGTAEVVTEDAVYEFACSLTPESAKEVVDRVARMAAQIDVGADAVIITCCSGDMDTLKAIAHEDAVHVFTMEEFTAEPERLPVGDTASINQPTEEAEESDAKAAPAAQSSSLFPSDTLSGSFLTEQMHPSKLTRHPSLLMRAQGLDEDHVTDLTIAYKEGRVSDPCDIVFDGTTYWVADGNHRHEAAVRAGVLLDVHVHKGTFRDAIILAMRANASHGLKPTDDDKRLKALTLLADPEWYKESDTVLAEDLSAKAITQQFLSGVRRQLIRLIPALQSDDASLDDESLAAKCDVKPALVRVVRHRLPDKELEKLTQNILGDDGKRRGADGVVRTVPTKTSGSGEEEASLFTNEEAAATSEAEASAKTDADAAAAPAADADEDESGADEAVIDEDISTPLTAAGWELVRADDREGVKFYAKNSKLNLVTGMYGTSKEACDEARRKQLEHEAQQTKVAEPEPPPFDAQFGVTMKNHGWELHREGRRFHATNKKLQMATILFDTAQQAIDDAVKQQDRYERDEKEKVQKQAEKEKRQAAENLLKDRDLTVTYTFMKELPGEVTVAVRLDEDAEGMEMETLDISKVRPFPEAVLEMITKQVSRPARKHKASAAAPAAARKAASKSTAKKSAVTRTKTMSKKTAGKQPAARAGGAKKASAAKKSGAGSARARK